MKIKSDEAAALFSSPEVVATMCDELLEIESEMKILSSRAEVLRRTLSLVAEISEVYAGVPLRVDQFDPEQTYDVDVHPLSDTWPRRWARACQNVRTKQWMVQLHGPGLNSGGEIHPTHFESLASAVSAAKRWTAIGLRA